MVFCNSVFANHIVVAASRLLSAAAACLILLSFAAGHRKSHWSGSIKAAIDLSAPFLNFGAGDFRFKNPNNFDAVARVLLCFATQPLQIAV